jgi:hypothetical protein
LVIFLCSYLLLLLLSLSLVLLLLLLLLLEHKLLLHKLLVQLQ